MPVLKYRNPETGRYEPVVGPAYDDYSVHSQVGARMTGPQTFNNAASTTLVYTAVDKDEYGYASTSSGRMTVPPGHGGSWFTLTVLWQFEGSNTRRFFVDAMLNGGAIDAGRIISENTSVQAQYRGAVGSIDLWLEDGDYVHIRGYVESAVGTARTSVNQSFSIIRHHGVPGPKGPRAASTHLGFGSTFPTSPETWDRYFRTDIKDGLEFYYDGTRWLSSTIFQTHSSSRGSMSGISGTTHLDSHVYDSDYDVWIVRYNIKCYVATTNDASNYWNIYEYLFNGAGTTLRTTTAGGTTSTWEDYSVDIGGSHGAAQEGFHFYCVKTGSPGNLDISARAEYRLVAT